MSGAEPAALRVLAGAVARRAGALLLERFGTPARGVEAKSSRTDLVSDADRDAEELIVSALRAARPGDGLLGEEGAGSRGTSGLRWVIDPLDGTTNFLWGIPQWAVSIAVEDQDGPLAGVVFDPCRGELFGAARGDGADLDGAVLRLGDGPPLAEALIATGFNYDRGERERQAGRMPGVIPAVRDIRRMGAAALDLAWVAAGRVDGYFETGLQPWDRAAGALIVAEAGGVVRELPASPGGVGPCTLAAPASLAEALEDLVRGG
ncbi:MAG: inositol monophosphatase family protein [Miltoncostaeaceae bacterium]